LSPSLLQSTRGDVVHLTKSLLFIPFQKDNGLVQPIVFVGWTLNYEMLFYAIFAASLFIKNPRLSACTTLGALVVLMLVHILLKPASIEADFFTQPILLEFAMGMALGLGLSYLPKELSTRWPLFLLTAIAVSAFVWTPMLGLGLDRAIIFGIPAFAIVFSAILLDRSTIKWPAALIFIGDASYAIYLTHFFVTQTVIKFAQKLQIENIGLLAALFIAALACVGLVGIAVHVMVEKPLTILARRLLGLSPKKPVRDILSPAIATNEPSRVQSPLQGH